jgi:hypothetical protein
MSTYSYCFDNPIRFFDFSGEDPGDIAIFFTGANFGQGMTPTTLRIANKIRNIIPGIEYSVYSSEPFGQHHFEKNTQEAYDQILSNYKRNPNGRIVIYGYSYGGQLANYLAKRLNKAGIKVNLLITVDAAAGYESNSADRKISGNVALNVNFYQYNTKFLKDPLLNHGNPNTAESNQTIILNFDETDDVYEDEGKDEKVDHLNIDEKTEPATINYIESAFPRKASEPRKKTITDILNDAGIPWKYDNSSESDGQSGNRLPFKVLYGVY